MKKLLGLLILMVALLPPVAHAETEYHVYATNPMKKLGNLSLFPKEKSHTYQTDIDYFTYFSGGDVYEEINEKKSNFVVDFLMMQFMVLGIISYQGAFREGLLAGPDPHKYADNVRHMKWHDGDSIYPTETLHVGVGMIMWGYWRHRGYSRTETVLAVFGTGLWREWVWKGWGIPPSFDDPFLFATSSLVTGLISEEVFKIDWERVNLFPYIYGKKEPNRDDTKVVFGFATFF